MIHTVIIDFKLSLESWSIVFDQAITTTLYYEKVASLHIHPENKFLLELALENYLSFGMPTGNITQECGFQGQNFNLNWFYTMTEIKTEQVQD